MFNNKKIDLILNTLIDLTAKVQENKNSILRIERKLKEEEPAIVENNSHVKESKEIKEDMERTKKAVKVKTKKKKLNFEKKSNVDKIGINFKDKTKDYPIETSFKNKTDMTIDEFSKVLKVKPQVLRNRLWRLQNVEKLTWTENDNFIYYLKTKDLNTLVKVLTKPAQDQLIRRYGYGEKSAGRKPHNYIA